MRNEKEWVEVVENGYNNLAWSNSTKIMRLANEALNNTDLDFSTRLYGNGFAGKTIGKRVKMAYCEEDEKIGNLQR